MAKGQSVFLGKTPKATGVPVRQVGNFSATPGVNNIVNTRGQANRKAYQPKSHPVSRPNLKGKVDNRKVG